MPGLFQGDIIVNNNQNLKTLFLPTITKWPNGVVFYTIETASFSNIELLIFYISS